MRHPAPKSKGNLQVDAHLIISARANSSCNAPIIFGRGSPCHIPQVSLPTTIVRIVEGKKKSWQFQFSVR